MSMKISIFYDTDKELEEVSNRLRDLGIKVKQADQKGKYRRAYISIGNTRSRKHVDKARNERYNTDENVFNVPDISREYPIS